MHTLKEYIDRLSSAGLVKAVSLSADLQVEISNIAYDNRRVKSGGLFVCKGATFKEEYLDAAIQAGSVVYVSERDYNKPCSSITVNDIRLAMAVIASLFYEGDTDSLKIVGVTGTKGKTTTAAFLNSLFDDYSLTKGSASNTLISSLYIKIGNEKRSATLSTPESFDLWEYLSSSAKHGSEFVTLEVSSQALKYARTKGVGFSVGVFLNIGEDHISDIEHKDFEDYFSSKLELFEASDIAVINSSSDFFERISLQAHKKCRRVVTFGSHGNEDIILLSKSSDKLGSSFSVKYKDTGITEKYIISLCGGYNIENALAAIAVAWVMGIPVTSVRSGLERTSVSGRGVVYHTADERLVAIVDYAHNKMSLEALLRFVREEYPDKKIVTLFGCPGGKAKNRRRDLGRVSSKYSDKVIITEDDPAKEELSSICKEIAGYVELENTEYEIIYDRGKAIDAAMESFPDAVVLVCGKGAENTQKRAAGSVLYEGDEYFVKRAIEKKNAAMRLKV